MEKFNDLLQFAGANSLVSSFKFWLFYAEFLEEFESIYRRFESEGPSSIITQWTEHSSFANGREIEIHDGVRLIKGSTRGLNPLGALRVQTKDAHIEEVYSGEVVSWN